MTTTGELLKQNSTAPDGSTALVHLQNQSGGGGGTINVTGELRAQSYSISAVAKNTISVNVAAVSVAAPTVTVTGPVEVSSV